MSEESVKLVLSATTSQRRIVRGLNGVNRKQHRETAADAGRINLCFS